MAKAKIPDPLERRHLIERPLDPARAQAIAEAYLAADRALEAVAFLKKADATEGLERLLREAVAAGDAFLLREVASALRREPDVATWREAERAAASAGKDRYVAEARRQAERLSSR